VLEGAVSRYDAPERTRTTNRLGRPNKRLKLAARTTRGSHLFVNDQALRRSLGAIR
jgi:hypothetical protein